MIANLFSMFDPGTSLFSLSWGILLLIIFILPGSYWALEGLSLSFLSGLSFVKKEVDCVLSFVYKGDYLFVSSLLLMLSLLNFCALFPFIFSSTSHLSVNLPLSYSLWLGVVIFGWYKSFSGFLSHLVPFGTPLFLISFMVMVELLSNLIRPLALTFRLTANIIAGHLLISIVGGALVSSSFRIMLLGSLFQFFLVMMEVGVSLIQAYVFSVLVLLYLSET